MRFRSDLVRDLRAIGLRPGGLVMVHAGCRAIGPVVGGPDEIHLAVGEALAPGGTMMMYAGCDSPYDDVGKGLYPPDEEQEIAARMPVFDKDTARANRDHGILAEFFRTWPGTVASRNPSARMAARGDRARWLVAGHAWNYGYGRNSPLGKLVENGGQVLLLGADHDQVTLLHYAEDIADVPDKTTVRYRVPIEEHGQRIWIACEEFDTSIGIRPWPERFFAEIVDGFIGSAAGADACRTGNVGDADAVLMDAAALVRYAVPVIERRAGALDASAENE